LPQFYINIATDKIDFCTMSRNMKIGIIGGGAAGMMAAAAIVESGADTEVFLIEKNPGLGRKVIISGGGRCNVTTGLRDMKQVMVRYPRGARFLRRAFAEFAPGDVYDWFETHGVPLKTEEDLRVFPQSDNGEDVVGVFRRLLVPPRAHVLLSHSVERIEKSGDSDNAGGEFVLTFKNGETLRVDRLILTTGGQARRYTGSTGDGYSFAEALGHTVTPLAASLNSFITQETWPGELSGVSFERVTFTAKTKKPQSWTGPFVCTHRGVSGPAVFALSSLIAFENYTKEHPLAIEIDWAPHVRTASLEKLLLGERTHRPNGLLKTTLHHYLPWRVVEMLMREHGISLERRHCEISNREIQTVQQLLKHCTIHAVGRGAGDEFVTAGGVTLAEVNPNTMGSKRTPGLFFAGELLDIDGFTGGFNLQASWATGRLAGLNAATR
jgi:predicted Rossmann fold flavoprotein